MSNAPATTTAQLVLLMSRTTPTLIRRRAMVWLQGVTREHLAPTSVRRGRGLGRPWNARKQRGMNLFQESES